MLYSGNFGQEILLQENFLSIKLLFNWKKLLFTILLFN